MYSIITEFWLSTMPREYSYLIDMDCFQNKIYMDTKNMNLCAFV